MTLPTSLTNSSMSLRISSETNSPRAPPLVSLPESSTTHVSARTKIPRDLKTLPFLNAGLSGWVYALDEFAVIKVARGPPEESLLDHVVERKILERLGEHPRIVRLLGVHKNALILERLLYPLRVRTLELRDNGAVPPPEDILKWSAQAAEGMHYFHGKNVMQVDIGLHNMLLNWDENLKYCDFAGSSIDGTRPHVFAGTRSENPRVPFDSPNVQSELFALGSAFYEMSTARKLYADKQDPEIAALLRKGEYPDVESLLLGPVMLRCWQGEYRNAREVAAEIRKMQRRVKLSDLNQSVPDLIRQRREENRRRGDSVSQRQRARILLSTVVTKWRTTVHRRSARYSKSSS